MNSGTIPSNFLSSLIEASSDAIFMKDVAGRYIVANPAAARIINRLPEDMIGKTDLDVMAPATATRLMEVDRRVMSSGETKVYEETVESPDSPSRVVQITKGPVRDKSGAVVGVFGIARDITEDKRLAQTRGRLYEEQLARAEAEASMRRSAFLAEIGSVLSTSLDYDVTLQNLARIAVAHLADWCIIRMFSENSDTVLSSALAHRDSQAEECLGRLQREYPIEMTGPHPVAKAMRTGQAIFMPTMSDAQIAEFAADARQCEWFETVGLRSLIVVPIAVRGIYVGAISLGSRVEHRYSLSDLALAETLVARASLAVENAILYDDARKAVRVRDEILSIASHELRTPLTPLKVQTQLLRRLVQQDLLSSMPRDQVVSMLDLADRELTRLAKLITNLLSVSRIASGSFVVAAEEFDLAEMIKGVVKRFEEEVKATSSTLDLVLELSDPKVHFDPLQIDQVLTNLLSNALKYGDGKPIVIRAGDLGDQIRVSVTDHGIGVAGNEIQRLFRRFERTTAARRFSGLGLGLYISRQIVTAHRGTISVNSREGEGSTFTIELPRR